MKKIICSIIAGFMVVSSLAGCGKSNKASIDTDKKYKYTMTMYQTEAHNPDNIQLKRLQEKYNIELEIWDIEWQKYDEILNLRLASGEIPDLLYTKTSTAANKYVNQDLVTEIDMNLLKSKGANILARIEESAPDTLKYYEINDKLYALPTFSVGAGPTGTPMVWRGDWLKNIGIDKTPQTLAEYENAFYKFVNNDPDKNDKNDTYALSRSGISAIFAAFGYVPALGQTGTPISFWQDKDGKLVFSAIQPEMKEALKLLNKWYKDGILDPEFITGENKGGYWALSHAFLNSRIGFTTHGMSYHWEPKFFQDGNAGQDTAELLKINANAANSLQITAKPPVVNPENPIGPYDKKLVRYERWMFGNGINREPGKMERIIEILNDSYASRESFDAMTKGEKGVEWDYVDKVGIDGNTYKQVQYLGNFANEQYRKQNQFGLTLFNPYFPGDEQLKTPRDIWATERGFNVSNIPFNELMAVLPSESKYKAELTKIEEETYIDLIVGEKPIDYFDTFVEKWRNAGGSQLEKEANEWYNSLTK